MYVKETNVDLIDLESVKADLISKPAVKGMNKEDGKELSFKSVYLGNYHKSPILYYLTVILEQNDDPLGKQRSYWWQITEDANHQGEKPVFENKNFRWNTFDTEMFQNIDTDFNKAVVSNIIDDIQLFFKIPAEDLI